MSDELVALESGEELFEAIRVHVAKQCAPLINRIGELEAEIKRIPKCATQGDPGLPGKDADPVLIAKMVADAVAAIPAPKDGEPGKDAVPVDVSALAEAVRSAVRADLRPELSIAALEAVAALPPPKQGDPGKDADPALVRSLVEEATKALLPFLVETAVAKLPRPKDGANGKSAFDLAVGSGFGGTTEQWLASLKGKDGVGIQGEPGPAANPVKIMAMVRDAVTAIPRPRDGKSADEPSVLAAAAELVAIKLLDKVEETVIDSGDGRHFIRRITMPSGKTIEAPFYQPAIIPRGIWSASKTYEFGDCVTSGGSSQLCMVEKTTQKPGDGADWVLHVRKGADGRDSGKSNGADPPRPVVRLR